MADDKNPIAFNPDTMTVAQLKECATTLRTLFENIDRTVDTPEDVAHFVLNARDHMNKKWHRR